MSGLFVRAGLLHSQRIVQFVLRRHRTRGILRRATTTLQGGHGSTPVFRQVVHIAIVCLVLAAYLVVVYQDMMMIIAADLIIARVLIGGRFGLAAALLQAIVMQINETAYGRRGGDGGLGEESLGLLEFAISFVRL